LKRITQELLPILAELLPSTFEIVRGGNLTVHDAVQSVVLTGSRELTCLREGPDCRGVYKTQRGFHGLVPDIGLHVQRMFPMLTIWNKRTISIRPRVLRPS